MNSRQSRQDEMTEINYRQPGRGEPETVTPRCPLNSHAKGNSRQACQFCPYNDVSAVTLMIFRQWLCRSFGSDFVDLSAVTWLIFRQWHWWSFGSDFVDLSAVTLLIFRQWHWWSFGSDFIDLSAVLSTCSQLFPPIGSYFDTQK